MRTALPRVFTVLLTLACLILASASMAAYFNRLDVHAEMLSPELVDYSFEPSAGENVTWTVTRRVVDSPDDSRSVGGQSPSPYEALAKARDDLSQRMNSGTSAMKTETDAVKAEIEAITAQQAQDLEALNRRIATLQTIADDMHTQWQTQSQAHQKASVDSKTTRDEVSRRREDVIRLTNELEEIRTDLFRLKEVRRTLTDQIVRLQIDNQTLEQRKTQLMNQGAQ
jgi:hypothetical protein